MFGRSNVGLVWMIIFLVGQGLTEPISEILSLIFMILFVLAAYVWWNSKGSGLK